MRLSACLIALAGMTLLAACGPDSAGGSAAGSSSSAGDGSPSAPSSSSAGASTAGPSDGASPSAPAPAPAPSASSPATPTSAAPATSDVPAGSCGGGTTVEVSDKAGLKKALAQAAPGQVIRLAPGRYEGNFTASAAGTAAAPIRLCGDRGAVLDGGSIGGDYTLHLDHASHWQVDGFTVTGGQKGVMVDGGVANVISGLLVTSMGDEAIHLRADSTDNVVSGNVVRDTGKRKPKFGEGIYVGTANSNWCQITKCQPDRSDRNVVLGNDISGTTAEAVDIKEGTTGGILSGNRFDGAGMKDSDSWVDVKGNDWRIEDNTGVNAPEDGFQVHEVVDGWGRGNAFSGNSAPDVPKLLVNIAGPKTIRNDTTVSCDNEDGGPKDGLSNIPCSR